MAMASVPQDGDDFDDTAPSEQTDDWTVVVDVFDVTLSFSVSNGNARLVESSCNCDATADSDCRHIGIGEGRVRAVFADDDLRGVRGRITQAPALWRPLVSEKEAVEASDTAVSR